MKHKGNTNVIEVFTQYCFLELSSKEALFFFLKLIQYKENISDFYPLSYFMVVKSVRIVLIIYFLI